MTFEYQDLHRTAPYRVRFALVRPMFLLRHATHHPHKTESIFANGHCLARDLEWPERETKFFEFEIPPS